MKHLFRGSRLVVLVMMLSIMTGCAIPGGKVPRTKLAAPAEDQTKQTLFYSIYSWGSVLSKEELLEELRNSPYFKNITNENRDEADIELYVTLSVKPSPNADTALSISTLTFGMIPVWESQYYKVTARVKNKKGLENEYTVNDSTFIVAWLPLVVFLPFTYDTDENVRRNMYRNIIQQMYEDGFIGET